MCRIARFYLHLEETHGTSSMGLKMAKSNHHRLPLSLLLLSGMEIGNIFPIDHIPPGLDIVDPFVAIF